MRNVKNQAFCHLSTPFTDKDGQGWASVYPRPQMKRDSFFSLCGSWSLSVMAGQVSTPLGEICVPFAPESALSGIGRALQKGERYVYERSFTLPDGFMLENGRVLLHFGAVDQIAEVWLNGKPVCTHEGGYSAFCADITDALSQGKEHLQVFVTDNCDLSLPYGKQRKKRGGMWYTPISGIWQPVWLECVPENHFVSLRLTPTLDSIRIESKGGGTHKKVTVSLDGESKSYTYDGDEITINFEKPRLWTPEEPTLYTFTLTDGTDTVTSYFGLRSMSVQKHGERFYLCLNGEPRFFSGVLDQGYFADGIFTPATEQGYAYDILTMKKMGFNMLRKHIKVEPDVFYYLCDKLGMVVFQDMVNSGKYRFFADTALPTLGKRTRRDKRTLPKQKERFQASLWDTVEALYNHPCVCYYTIFNEGWGQHDADTLYDKAKMLDPSRIWDSTSGWFYTQKSDVQSEHVYFRKIRLSASEGRPLVLSEFGGYSLPVKDHVFNVKKAYGYRKMQSGSALLQALSALYTEEIVPAIKEGLCAAVLTQLSDVEDEVNGLVTYDRQVEKVDTEVMAALAETVQAAFRECLPH